MTRVLSVSLSTFQYSRFYNGGMYAMQLQKLLTVPLYLSYLYRGI